MTRVLIADDNADNLCLLKALLSEQGFAVDEARNGAEALARAREQPPQLIISDLLMPVMDGYTLLRQWKADEQLKGIPFAVYTATYTEPQDEQLAVDMGADAFLLKPTELGVFLARIQGLLAQARSGNGPPARAPLPGGTTVFEDHGEILVRKLEEKAQQLETANRLLREDVRRREEAEAQTVRAQAALLRTLDDQYRSESALRDSEERFRRAVTEAPIPIVIHAEDGTILQLSETFCELSGYSRAELATISDWTERAYGERQPLVQADIEALYRINARKRSGDYHIRTREGALRIWDFSSAPLGRLPDGRRLVISMAVDVTERRQAEAELRETSHYLENLFNCANAPILVWDAQQRITRFNQACERLTGRRATEVLGRELDCLFPAAERDAMRELVTRAAGPGETVEVTLAHADGTTRTLLWSSATLLALDGRTPRATIAQGQDITDRKRLEQERAVLEAQLRQQQKLEAIGTLASGVAHEINNPVNGVMNYAQLILDDAPPGSRLAELAAEIISESNRVAGIVHNLSQFSRDEQQTPTPAQLARIVQQGLALIQTTLRHNLIEPEVELARDLPPLPCRPQQIQQVIMNLLTNARDALNDKYAEAHPDKRLRVAVSAFTQAGRDWQRVTVEDHGGGISPKIRDRIFEPFFTTKGRHRGTGLGLAISHGMVKEHRGRLWFETEPGQWTRFHLDLPLDEPGSL